MYKEGKVIHDDVKLPGKVEIVDNIDVYHDKIELNIKYPSGRDDIFNGIIYQCETLFNASGDVLENDTKIMSVFCQLECTLNLICFNVAVLPNRKQSICKDKMYLYGE